MQSNRSLPGIINDLNIGVKRQLSHMPPDFGDVLPNKIETVGSYVGKLFQYVNYFSMSFMFPFFQISVY